MVFRNLPDILYKYKTKLFATISNFQDETYIFLTVILYFKVLQHLTLWSALRLFGPIEIK